jgi:ribonuclease HI
MSTNQLLLYIDGGARYDGTGIYFSVAENTLADVNKWADRLKRPEYTTNNEAEYCALIFALEELYRRRWQYDTPCRVILHCDSKLIVNQCNNRWRIKEPRLLALKQQVDERVQHVSEFGFHVHLAWVRREENVKRLGH